jgi:hypothetical protein
MFAMNPGAVLVTIASASTNQTVSPSAISKSARTSKLMLAFAMNQAAV